MLLQVDPSFQLVSICESIWLGYKFCFSTGRDLREEYCWGNISYKFIIVACIS